MDLTFPSKTVLLRACSNNIVGFRRKGNTFVIGFPNKKIVKKCSSHISSKSNMFLKELSLSNVKSDMDAVIQGFDEMTFNEVFLDTDAKLFIEKKEPEPFFYQTMNTDDLLMYPFTKNIGVVYIDKLFRETKTHLIMNAHVIAPTFSPEMFEL
jgi:hypothetical protein